MRPSLLTGGLHPGHAVRLGLRSLRVGRGPALTAALTLSIGFGAASAIFSVIRGFSQPLPVPHGQDIVRLDVQSALSHEDVQRLSSGTGSFSGLASFVTSSHTLIDGEGSPRRVQGARIDPGVFAILQTAPSIGRLPSQQGERGVVLGHDVWREFFDGSTEILGQSVRLDGEPRIIVGVMPEGFEFPFGQSVWTLFEPGGSESPVETVGRLSDGASLAEASLELRRALRGVDIGQSETAASARVLGFTQDRGESGEGMALLALLMIVLSLLLVSCSNVSNLLLVRATDRARALAVHAALGASPGQVVLQMLTEAFLIALAGAVGGLAIAVWAVRFIEGTLSGHWGYYWMRVELRPEVLLFLFALSLLTAVVSGIVPAVRVGRSDLTTPLKREGAKPRGTGWLSWSLLTAQVTLSFVALTLSALMASGLLQSRSVAEGFPAESVRVASLILDGDAYASADQQKAFREGLLSEIDRTRDLGPATLSDGLPGLNAPIAVLRTTGAEPDAGELPTTVLTFGITPGFFEVFGVSLLHGRTFDVGTTADDERVAIVSEDFALRHLGTSNVVGRRIHLRRQDGEGWWTIGGVVSTMRIYESEEQRGDWVYLPLDQMPSAHLYLSFHSAAGPAEGHLAMRAAVRAIDPGLPFGGTMAGEGGTVSDVLAFVRRIFQTVGTLSVMGGVASLLVAAVGLYGILSFEVRRRTADLGIKLALGAGAPRILRGVVLDGLKRLAPGLALGILLTYLAAPFFQLFFSGVNPRDPLSFSAITLGYVLIAMVATLAPALRAASLDPAQVLGSD